MSLITLQLSKPVAVFAYLSPAFLPTILGYFQRNESRREEDENRQGEMKRRG
jgi:hypothetical protein